jgi:hypothetical protein
VILTPQPCARFDRAARERLFAGDILVFRAVTETAAFVAALRERTQAAFAPHEPPQAQQHLAREELARRCEALTQEVEGDRGLAEQLDGVLVALGADPVRTHRDRMRLRIQVSDGDLDGRRPMTLPPHRDTWGSNVMAQVNWWAPLWPLDPGRTVIFWPALFARAVPNTSAGWDYEALIASRRRGETGYPLLPRASAPEALGPARPAILEVGDIMAFSGAHLHAGTVNTTGLVRFSFEMRSVDTADLREDRGAPNADAAAPRMPLHWFRRLSDGTPLAQV